MAQKLSKFDDISRRSDHIVYMIFQEGMIMLYKRFCSYAVLLFYIVLYSSLHHSITVYCFIWFYIEALYRSIFLCIVLYCSYYCSITLYSAIYLYIEALYDPIYVYIALYCSLYCSIILFCIALSLYIALYRFIKKLCIVVYCSILLCIALFLYIALYARIIISSRLCDTSGEIYEKPLIP